MRNILAAFLLAFVSACAYTNVSIKVSFKQEKKLTLENFFQIEGPFQLEEVKTAVKTTKPVKTADKPPKPKSRS
jgi:hypothetical protein